MKATRSLSVACVVALGLASSLQAANRFSIPDLDLPVSSTGNKVPIRLDLDQDVYAFSVHVTFDATKVRVTQVALGSAVTGLSPEYSFGKITASPGSVVHGVVFDTSGPSITKKLTSGTGKEVLVLTVDVLATQPTTTDLQLVNQQGPPARLNVLTNAQGDSVSPAPALDAGTLTIKELAVPRIDGVLFNEGSAGTVFMVVGKNFDVSGFRVSVCGMPASFEFRGIDTETAHVTAPSCAVSGWAPLLVCNDVGCAPEVAQGFNYTSSGTPFVRGNANDDAAVDISDGIAILNDLFLGIPAAAPCRDAMDSNDSGSVDISDGIYLLSFLFQGGDDIPPPYPAAGLDPTPDDLPDC